MQTRKEKLQAISEKVKAELIKIGCAENIRVDVDRNGHTIDALSKEGHPIFGCDVQVFFKMDYKTFQLKKEMKVKSSTIEIDGGESGENAKIQNLFAISKNFETALEIFYTACLEVEGLSEVA